jgi:hypothetical protein
LEQVEHRELFDEHKDGADGGDVHWSTT